MLGGVGWMAEMMMVGEGEVRAWDEGRERRRYPRPLRLPFVDGQQRGSDGVGGGGCVCISVT